MEAMKVIFENAAGVQLERSIDLTEYPRGLIGRLYEDVKTDWSFFGCDDMDEEYLPDQIDYEQSEFILNDAEGNEIPVNWHVPLKDQPELADALAQLQEEDICPFFWLYLVRKKREVDLAKAQKEEEKKVNEVARYMAEILFGLSEKFEFSNTGVHRGHCEFIICSENPVRLEIRENEAAFWWESCAFSDPELVEKIEKMAAYGKFGHRFSHPSLERRDDNGKTLYNLWAGCQLTCPEEGKRMAESIAANLEIFRMDVDDIAEKVERLRKEYL